jgi:hypothetical protein
MWACLLLEFWVGAPQGEVVTASVFLFSLLWTFFWLSAR